MLEFHPFTICVIKSILANIPKQEKRDIIYERKLVYRNILKSVGDV